MNEKIIKEEFDDWMALLKRTGNEDLLKDPYNVWLEAWHVANMKKDPAETTDLSDQYPDLIRRMNAVVQREHQHPHIKEWEFIDPKFSK